MNITNFKSKIYSFSKHINQFITNENKNNIKRIRKTDLHDAFLYKLLSNQPKKNTTSATNTINDFRKENISRQAYCKRSNNIDISFYEKLLKEIDNYIHNNFKIKNHMDDMINHQIYAVDGTNNNLLSNLTNANFKKNKNGSITAESMGIFNITYNVPINIVINEHHNERKSLIDYLNTTNNMISKRSIIVMDRGYCSKEIYNELSKHELYFICRIKKNDSMITNKNDDIININEKNIKHIRIINYKCNNNEYYIATNLIDKVNYPIELIKKIYHKRWNIEDFFRYLKKNNDFQYMDSKKYDSIKKDIYAQLILSKFVYLFSNYFSKDLPLHKKVNMTSLTTGLYERFIINFIYCSKYTKKFSKNFINMFIKIYINIINTDKGTQLVKPRISKTPYTKWYFKSLLTEYNKKSE
jgi:hypothetical protein